MIGVSTPGQEGGGSVRERAIRVLSDDTTLIYALWPTQNAAKDAATVSEA